MTLQTSNPRAKQRWTLLVGAVAALTLGLATIALAVHDLNFQLDGDVSASTTTNVGGHTQAIDWDSLFDSAGGEKALPSGFTASGFDRDFLANPDGTFNTNDPTTFATGSKDTLPISGWQCNFDHNTNSKIDIMNSYAAAYTDPATNHQIIYFALERNSNSGDGNVGFWFLQDNVGCDATNGTQTFSGAHTDGDLLIVSAFTNGGAVSNIDVYRWNGGANGSLGTASVVHGLDCKSTSGGDSACATVNGPTNGTAGTITTPWLTSNKQDGVGHSLRTSEFFEGGVDLTASNLAGKCFNVFIGDTRSSQSTTATLFDYARGVIGECVTTLVTTPKDGAGNNIPAAGLSIGANARVDVKDSALLTVSGATGYGGNVTFSLCGPLALTSTTNCQTGGVQIGSPVNVTGTSPETVVGPTATLTSAGRYCWRAVYSGDATKGVGGATDPSDATSTTECFKVTPLQPTLTTQASADVTLGSAISDTATISGTAKQPGTDGIAGSPTINATAATQLPAAGSISFTAYGPGNCTTVAMATTTRPISGNGTYPTASQTAVSFIPSAIGTYTFVASYDGNSPNTLSIGNSVCPDPSSAESVTVTGNAGLTTAQNWLPNDTATLTGPTNLNGSLTFTLYNDGTCGQSGGTSQYTLTTPVSNAASGTTFPTANTNVKAIATGSYSWLVHYDDTTLADPPDKCESTALTITN